MTQTLKKLQTQAEKLAAQQQKIDKEKEKLAADLAKAEADEKEKAEAAALKKRQAEASTAFEALKDTAAEINEISAHLSHLIQTFKEKAALTNSKPGFSGSLRGEVNGALNAVRALDLPVAHVADDGLSIHYGKACQTFSQTPISKERIIKTRQAIAEGKPHELPDQPVVG